MNRDGRNRVTKDFQLTTITSDLTTLIICNLTAVFSVLFQGKTNCTGVCGNAQNEEATFDKKYYCFG